ncbi:hypothetical protein TNCV_1637281 [Trichonephila clavipes]|nr:hypothetical protein TNCV_1637281 [Trichonephila clavipes]
MTWHKIGLPDLTIDNSDNNQKTYTASYLDFYKLWESKMNSLVNHLNSSRTSDDSSTVIKKTEKLDSKLRGFPFNLIEETSAALRNLSDVLIEVRFKFTHQRKQELAEHTKLLQAHIGDFLTSLLGLLSMLPCIKWQEIIQYRGVKQCEETARPHHRYAKSFCPAPS